MEEDDFFGDDLLDEEEDILDGYMGGIDGGLTDEEEDENDEEKGDNDEDDEEDEDDKLVRKMKKKGNLPVYGVGDPRRTKNRMLTSFEETMILSNRANQINEGSNSYLSLEDIQKLTLNISADKAISDILANTVGDSLIIAREEYDQNLLGNLYIIETDLDNHKERWQLSELQGEKPRK